MYKCETLERERKQTNQQFPVSSLWLSSSIDTSLLVLSHSVTTDTHMCDREIKESNLQSLNVTLFMLFITFSYVCIYIWFFLFQEYGVHIPQVSTNNYHETSLGNCYLHFASMFSCSENLLHHVLSQPHTLSNEICKKSEDWTSKLKIWIARKSSSADQQPLNIWAMKSALNCNKIYLGTFFSRQFFFTQPWPSAVTIDCNTQLMFIMNCS